VTQRRVCHGLFAALATLITWSGIAALKVATAVVLTTTVILVPGTKGPNGTANETPVFLKDVLQHELQGWVYQQATDGWAMNTYPRSMGELTGKNDPLFDSSVSTGAVNLDVLITDTRASGAIGFGYSQGATVVTQWLRDHANGKDSNAPAADKMSFVLIGSPNRPNGGLLARMPGLYVPILGVTFIGAMPDTQYKVTDVMRQYDLFGDFPIDPLNVLSVLNVLADAGSIHGNYLNVDVNDPNNWVEQHGNTTYIMEYAQHLPLLQPLYNMAAAQGMTQTPVLDAIEPVMRYLVELGYDRTNQSTTSTFQPGSSVVRLAQTLPELRQAVNQGIGILQSELHELSVQPATTQQPAASLPTVSIERLSGSRTPNRRESQVTNDIGRSVVDSRKKDVQSSASIRSGRPARSATSRHSTR